MIAPPDESDRRIADDVLPEQIDEPAVPVELNELFPWHRPRKQLVREQQWLRFSKQLIEREKGGHGLRNPLAGISGGPLPYASRNRLPGCAAACGCVP